MLSGWLSQRKQRAERRADRAASMDKPIKLAKVRPQFSSQLPVSLDHPMMTFLVSD